MELDVQNPQGLPSSVDTYVLIIVFGVINKHWAIPGSYKITIHEYHYHVQ